MNLALYIKKQSGKDYKTLFGLSGSDGAIQLRAGANGVPEVVRWTTPIVGMSQLTPVQIAAVLAMPDEVDPDDVKAECSRRILALASDDQQRNILAHMAAAPTDAEKTVFLTYVAWINDTRAACSAMIASNVLTFKQDINWPAVPADVATFVSSI